MLVAFETTWDLDNGRIGRAVVCDIETLQVGVVCARIDQDKWEPLYFMDRDGNQKQLPSCFELAGEGVDALNSLAKKQENPE
jgi:hypothetical protein